MSGWILKRGGREVPIPDDATLRKWADEHRFNPSDHIFHPVLQRWLYAQDVLEIRSAFEKAPSPPTTARDSSSNIIANSQTIWKTRQPDGTEQIVGSLETLREWASAGKIVKTDYVWNPVLQQWVYAMDVVELAGHVGGARGVSEGRHGFGCGVFLLIIGLAGAIVVNPLLGAFVIIIGLIMLVVAATRKVAPSGMAGIPTGLGVSCPTCGFVFHGEYGREGWWCPTCGAVRH